MFSSNLYFPSLLDPSSPPFSQEEKGVSTLPLSTWERGKE